MLERILVFRDFLVDATFRLQDFTVDAAVIRQKAENIYCVTPSILHAVDATLEYVLSIVSRII